MKQVNYSEYVDGSSQAWISDYSEDGYVGKLVDTQYIDGCDTTDWCIYHGSQEECEKYIKEHFHV